ncbi:hypothetical protein F885_03019 [Acinetobacter higginsii]|nr:hypothetical protein F885_03019 [Acinetobacter higginsii]
MNSSWLFIGLIVAALVGFFIGLYVHRDKD